MYPPRPKGKIAPGKLGIYEKKGRHIAQRKFNGTNVVVHIPADRSVDGIYMLNRRGETSKQFKLTTPYRKELLSLDLKPGECWLNGELLNNRSTSHDDGQYKGRIVLYDILQMGRYFFSSPNTMGRIDLLDQVCRYPKSLEPNLGIALEVTENIWMAQTFTEGFSARYADFLEYKEIEGLVLKRRNATLGSYGRDPYEVTWMVRCRKPDDSGGYAY